EYFNLHGKITFKDDEPSIAEISDIEVKADTFATSVQWVQDSIYYDLEVLSRYRGTVVAESDYYYFDPASIGSLPPEGVFENIAELDFDAYKIDPKMTINNQKNDSVSICDGDTIKSSIDPSDKIFVSISGTYQSYDVLWEKYSGSSWNSISTELIYSFSPSENTLYKLTVNNQVGEVLHTDTALLNIIVKERPTENRDLKGPLEVCRNQGGVIYYVDASEHIPGDYYSWEIDTLGSLEGSDKTNTSIVNWHDTPGSANLTLRTYRNGCEANDHTTRTINILDSEARPVAGIEQKDDNMLLCSDADAGWYEWGYHEMDSGFIEKTVILEGKNEWYCRFDDRGDHINLIDFRYFVITYDDKDNLGCGTTSYFNDFLPLIDEELEAGEMLIYPNPADDALYIRLQKGTRFKECTVDLYDRAGNKVLSREYTPNQNGNTFVIKGLQRFQPGLYFIHVLYDDRSLASKVIIR
ncbi:MAG: T9SS type A sorting domain-containing protein, partial [bacterium]